MLKETYQLTVTDSSDEWASSVKQVLDESRFSYVWNTLGVHHNELIDQQRLLDQYLQVWGSKLSFSRKLRPYRLFKNTHTYAPYLNLPPHLRVSPAKFGSSAHRLKIGTGRYTHACTHTPLEERTCLSCGVLEDEVQFLIDC